jgi:hypothetical protein
MHTPIPYKRVAGFLAALALAFGVAAVAGGAIGPEPRSATKAEADAHGAMAAPDPVRGLAVAAGDLALRLDTPALPRGRSGELRFAVTRGGRALRAFPVTHERRMHLIVVRRDGAGFQHLHPRLAADGTWRTPVTLPDAGAYRVFADFEHDGEPRTLAADLTVDGVADYRPLPAPAAEADAGDGYRVRLDTGAGRDRTLRFTVTKDGHAVTTEPYLGAGGHLVALRAGDLAFLHVHPEARTTFETTFPTAGRYRLYLQFKHGGRVHTAGFTREVA